MSNPIETVEISDFLSVHCTKEFVVTVIVQILGGYGSKPTESEDYSLRMMFVFAAFVTLLAISVVYHPRLWSNTHDWSTQSYPWIQRFITYVTTYPIFVTKHNGLILNPSPSR